MQATIHNEFLTLTVDTHGAEAVSLKNVTRTVYVSIVTISCFILNV